MIIKRFFLNDNFKMIKKRKKKNNPFHDQKEQKEGDGVSLSRTLGDTKIFFSRLCLSHLFFGLIFGSRFDIEGVKGKVQKLYSQSQLYVFSSSLDLLSLKKLKKKKTYEQRPNIYFKMRVIRDASSKNLDGMWLIKYVAINTTSTQTSYIHISKGVL